MEDPTEYTWTVVGEASDGEQARVVALTVAAPDMRHALAEAETHATSRYGGQFKATSATRQVRRSRAWDMLLGSNA